MSELCIDTFGFAWNVGSMGKSFLVLCLMESVLRAVTHKELAQKLVGF